MPTMLQALGILFIAALYGRLAYKFGQEVERRSWLRFIGEVERDYAPELRWKRIRVVVDGLVEEIGYEEKDQP